MERINVTVRARPLSTEDAKTSPWRISGNSIFLPNHSSKFEFDRIFGEDSKTYEVYSARTKEIVGGAVRGFNGTVFAYGQTNSGKTHTMRGSSTEPGVIPLAVHDLFDTIQQEVDREFLLRMSYMEIYNEDINDLLAPEHRKLQIHENIERGIYVAGLKEEIVASPQQVLDLMQFGESHRHIGETNMNVYSSRSHTIFRMIIESRDRTEDQDIGISCDAVRVSVLNLVDLAGSERAAKTGAEGVRLKEGSHINKSLMTLGTVIKKLSEGAESQGGHVPYRDSKLTRILQPALGGNANTAIICNITLAQVHADETRSSLQFASRALRVTNCAHVNEILTDAALLKRQKKEIEELRAKLQGSHSEHLEEEILNLRNKLLQYELERERITLELEEEKRAQADREKVLLEQAKKIKNLTSMVLYSSRDENRDRYKKGKRRDTWCPSNASREILHKVDPCIQSRVSDVNSMRVSHDMGPLVPFEELVCETQVREDPCKKKETSNNNASDDCTLPDPCTLLHVTSRRKVPPRKKVSAVGDNGSIEMQAAYEELLLKFETQRTMSEIQIDSLTRQLVEVNFLTFKDTELSASDVYKVANGVDKNMSLRESEAILVIKQLQEKIKILEKEESSNQKNLDNVVELATEQSICANEKFEELQRKLQIAQEEARVANEQVASNEVDFHSYLERDVHSAIKLSNEIEDIAAEVLNTTKAFESVSSLLDEVFQIFSTMFPVLHDFKSSICQSSHEQELVVNNYENLLSCMKQRVSEVDSEKILLQHLSSDLQKQIEELTHKTQSYEGSFRTLTEQHDIEKEDFHSQIEILGKELACLSSISLAKEKENLRKDLDKTKIKLKETESELKTVMQEKTKLEGEKASAEREVKKLHGQKALLQRDISKRDINRRDSLSGRRRDSVIDSKRAKDLAASFEQTMPEEYEKFEVHAFEMEATIASLEDEVAAANKEREEATVKSQSLALELESLVEKLDMSKADLNVFQEENSCFRIRLEESASNQKKMESSIKLLIEEKEELAMQLTNSLLEMEEERAIWIAREKASVEAIEEKTKLHTVEITSLSKAISEARNALESCREECKVLREALAASEKGVKWEMNCSTENCPKVDQLKNDLKRAGCEREQYQEDDKSKIEGLSVELHGAQRKVGTLEKELNVLNQEREEFLSQAKELESRIELQNSFQDVQNQLHTVTVERDNLLGKLEKYHSNAIEIQSTKQHCDDMLLEKNNQVAELERKLSSIEVKLQSDEALNSKERAKLRMRVRGTQALLDAFRIRHGESVEESDHMNREFEEASKKLKSQLASCGVEVLNLKKLLAVTSSSGGNS